MKLKLPTYIAHPYRGTDDWAVSRYDGRGGWQNTGAPMSHEKAQKLVRQGRRELRAREKTREKR